MIAASPPDPMGRWRFTMVDAPMRSDPIASAADAAAPAVERLVAGVTRHGYGIEPAFVPAADVAALRDDVLSSDARGALEPAGVGRGTGHAVDSAIRGDRILWLDLRATSAAAARVAEALETVRQAMNRDLALGLLAFEGHYALYPAGAGYARHRDRFRDDDTRVLSVVLYLNDTRWCEGDGGALRLHLGDGRVRDVLPHGGTLVVFLAERFVHEVLPASRPRVSMAGWFRRRALGDRRVGEPT
jgi:SM-20-related protein